MSEHNLIQRPELIRGLQQATGLRQPSLLPTLSTSLQATLGLGNINEDPRTARPESFAALIEIVPDALNIKRALFANPLNSERIAVLRRLHVYGAEDWLALNPLVSLVYDLQPTTGGLQFGTLLQGQRLVTGYQGHGGGVAPPVPPQGLDFNFQLVGGSRTLPRSVMGWMSVPPNGISGGYIWRGLLGGIAGVEILEDFKVETGPRMIVFPDGLFELYCLDNGVHMYVNLWWDEYPIT